MNKLWNGILRMTAFLMLTTVFLLVLFPLFSDYYQQIKDRYFNKASDNVSSNQLYNQGNDPNLNDEPISENFSEPGTDFPKDSYITPPVYGYDENLAKGLYFFTLHTRLGDLVYYTQEDTRWSEARYGEDPIISHGCGPTLLAILAASYIDPSQDPATMAEWAYQNGYYSRRDGSYHSIISKGLASLGFEVKSFSGRSPESVYGALDSGYFLIALMGEGNFTANGHFILLTDIDDEGHIRIADPKSFVHTQQSWDASLLLSQLKHESSSGGPLWAVKPPAQ